MVVGNEVDFFSNHNNETEDSWWQMSPSVDPFKNLMKDDVERYFI